MEANDVQIGGKHYQTGGLQHWDIVLMFGLGYFEGQITKYLFRWRKKNGLEDLKKARHFLDKLIESEEKPVKVNVPDWLQYVKPTGWIGFVFEGADAAGFLYTCGRCGAKIRCQAFEPPWNWHNALACDVKGSSLPLEEQLPPEEQSLHPGLDSLLQRPDHPDLK